MPTQSADAIIEKLHSAGINLSLAPNSGIAVAPSSRLNDELRLLIRNSKALLVEWVKAANDRGGHEPDPPNNQMDWKVLAAAYHAHHFNCRICIAAGRGECFGQRCSAGIALWLAYLDCTAHVKQ